MRAMAETREVWSGIVAGVMDGLDCWKLETSENARASLLLSRARVEFWVGFIIRPEAQPEQLGAWPEAWLDFGPSQSPLG